MDYPVIGLFFGKKLMTPRWAESKADRRPTKLWMIANRSVFANWPPGKMEPVFATGSSHRD